MRTLIVVLVVMLAAPLAWAQSKTSYGLFRESDFRPQISKAQMAVIGRALELSEEELDLANDLHEGHAGRVRREGADIRAKALEIIEEAQLIGRLDDVEDLYEIRGEWSDRRESLDEEFLTELKLILSDEQRARWPVVERELRRMDQIVHGYLAGETVDLTLMVDVDDEAMTDRLIEALDRYATAIDSALRAREDFFDDHPSDEYRQAIIDEPGRAKRLFQRAQKARSDVRDVNVKFVPIIAAALPEDDAERFREEWLERITGSASNRTFTADKVITGAESLESLTDEQADRLIDISNRYERERHKWLERYAEVVMEVESEVVPFELQRALGDMPEEEPEEPSRYGTVNERALVPELGRIWREKLQLDRRIRREVEGLLTSDQSERMPLLIGNFTIRSGEIYGAGERSWY